MKHQRYGSAVVVLLLCSALLISFSLLSGCKGSTGSAGSTTGSISGLVTNATATTVPVAGVTVSTKPDVGSTTTDANGNYSMSLPAGSYTITFAKTNFTSVTAATNVAVGTSTQINASLGVSSAGIPSLTLTSSATSTYVGYGASFTVTSTVSNPIGNTLTYTWKSATAGTDQTTATATTPSLTTALSRIDGPSTDPGGYVSGYTQESRLGVLPITADTRGAKTVSLTVDDGQGAKGTGSITVNAAGIQPGLKTVALGVPVYLNSGTTSTTTWTVTPPSGSGVPTTLSTGRNPSFTPDVVGPYVITATTPTVYTMTIYAGKWVGVISGGSYTSKKVTEADGMWYGWAPSSTQSSFTYTNWPQVTVDTGCSGATSCHRSGGTAPDVAAEWKDTVHATFFSRGIENITSNGSTCLTCHTTGYDTIANNNDGFDDIAKTEGFVYPTKATGAWSRMTTSYPLTAQRSNIQCENCHGPQDNSGAHHLASSGTSSSSARVSYSAEVCASCHASGTGHHIYSEWKASGHSGNPGSHSGADCGRCHEAEAFVTYLDQLTGASPVPGNIQATVDWDSSNNHGVTCTACHDPHSDANPNQLRVYDSRPILQSGISVVGLGKGALCVQCHNLRDGIECATALTATFCPTLDATKTYLHEDAATGGKAPESLDRPHHAPQADVLMGRNAYFMGTSLPILSKHANVEDSCVGCHMALNPQTHLSHGAPAVSGHVFAIEDADVATVCANCHSANVTGEGLMASVDDQLDKIGPRIAKYLQDRIQSSGTTTLYAKPRTGSVQQFAAATIVVKYVGDGSWNFNTSTTTFRTTGLYTDSGLTTNLVTLSDAGYLKLLKWIWNATIVENDASHGIHNPTFILGVLNATSQDLTVAGY